MPLHDGRVTVFDRRPALRWAAPLVAGGVIAAAVVVGAAGANADAGLPERTAAELLVALQKPSAHALSGTVSATADLGLPTLPTTGGRSSDDGPTKLLSGTHTARVWTDGEGKSRVDLLGPTDEFDVIRNGTDVWTWSSSKNEATHYTLPEHEGTKPAAPTDLAMPSTPQEAAEAVLAALDPTTAVTTSGASNVAGRPAYNLVLTPKQDGTRVARVSLAVDAETNVPLRVLVFSTQLQDPAIDVGFTSVDFAAPPADVFAFTPPAGAEVIERTGDARDDDGHGKDGLSRGEKPTVVGKGWTTVVVLPAPPPDAAAADDPTDGTDQLAAMIGLLPTTSGPWGSGHVLDGTLFSAIVADDGRVAIGTVDPELLSAALSAQ